MLSVVPLYEHTIMDCMHVKFYRAQASRQYFRKFAASEKKDLAPTVILIWQEETMQLYIVLSVTYPTSIFVIILLKGYFLCKYHKMKFTLSLNYPFAKQ